MLTQISPLATERRLQSRVIPIVENRGKLEQALHVPNVDIILLRHCNPLEFTTLLDRAHQRSLQVYVNVDHIGGICPDAAGLGFLAHRLHISSIISSNPRTLALAKNLGLQTVQRVFAIDSTGLEAVLEAVDMHNIDMLDISPALVVPYVVPHFTQMLQMPFIASGLIHTAQQIQAVLKAGALRVAVARPELWS